MINSKTPCVVWFALNQASFILDKADHPLRGSKEASRIPILSSLIILCLSKLKCPNKRHLGHIHVIKTQNIVWLFYKYLAKLATNYIEFIVHTSIVCTWISQWFLAKKNYFYFSSVISQELFIASFFIIKAPFLAAFHV